MSSDAVDLRVPGTNSPQQSPDRECLEQKPTTLRGWTSAFTDCLQKPPVAVIDGPCDENGNGSFILLDNVMESGASGFCENLSKELEGFVNKLQPARTTGDHRADEILTLLQSRGTHFPSTENVGVSVRGDQNIFVSRESRRKKSFAKKHPCLSRLISTASRTFLQEFCNKKSGNASDTIETNKESIRFDFSMTSVQLAMYPGDSKSGYRRHCDRGQSCQQEGTIPSTKNSIKPERLVTCIYYLTDKDWDGDLDGGALRLFHLDSNGDNHSRSSKQEPGGKNEDSSSHTDIFPFRDRMVVFRSDRVEHQVMPSHRRSRLAITMWFYGITGADAKFENSSFLDTNTFGVAPHHVPPPLPIHSVPNTNDPAPSIFVSIASYRDSETRPTIDAMLSTAFNPRRVFTGVVAQLVEGEKYDEEIWASIKDADTPMKHQLRVMRLHARDATGPCYARGLCQSLYRGEDYVLQIDSHMRFRQNWDEYLVQTIRGLQDRRQKLSDKKEKEQNNCDKIMLTTYPVGYTLPNKIPNETRGTYLVPWKFDDQGMLRQRGRLVRRKSSTGGPTTSGTDKEINSISSMLPHDSHVGYKSSVNHAHRQYLYAGGFNFGPSRVVLDVPYDTMGLHHLFFGEELSMAVRLFTHGYDLYAPEETVCYHLWSRSHRPTNHALTETKDMVEEKKKYHRELSKATVKKQLLGDEAMVGVHYGLGKARTAAAFARHLGVDFEKHTFVGEGWEYGELTSTDFVGHADNREGGKDEEPLFPAADSSGSSSTTSVEAKVASLDHKAQSLIATFLQGIQ